MSTTGLRVPTATEAHFSLLRPPLYPPNLVFGRCQLSHLRMGLGVSIPNKQTKALPVCSPSNTRCRLPIMTSLKPQRPPCFIRGDTGPQSSKACAQGLVSRAEAWAQNQGSWASLHASRRIRTRSIAAAHELIGTRSILFSSSHRSLSAKLLWLPRFLLPGVLQFLDDSVPYEMTRVAQRLPAAQTTSLIALSLRLRT